MTENTNGHDPQRALYAALARAIHETRAVPKDGPGQGYVYARAENVMREADRVLTPNGITVCPVGASLTVAGTVESKNGARSIMALTCRFLVAHESGGSFVGEMSIAVGTNLAATPPQATSSAYTCCERDFYRALLRMPRGPDDDVEHQSNQRREREDTEPPPPARPSAPVPPARKAAIVLRDVGAIKTPDAYSRALDRWHEVMDARRDGDDRGYSDDEVEQVKAALDEAKRRVGAA